MGISLSCPFGVQNDIEAGLETLVIKSINFGNDEEKTPVRSVSFKCQDLEPTIMRSYGSEMLLEGSVGIRDKETNLINSSPFGDSHRCISLKADKDDMILSKSDSMLSRNLEVSMLSSGHPKHEAAVKLQKVYKSFRTRRKLADCAVLIEQSWWKLLDFAELKHSSISFFDLDKHETAISRWSRARTRAAKVGKGLSKNGKAQKLALQHWLEAIDPRHRYGHNLHFYYVKWLHSQSKEPFFYWLDIGEGKEVNLVDKCPRTKLQQQCIKYLGPMERKAYEVRVENGKLFYTQTGMHLDTTGEPKGAKWIFVLSTSKTLYVGKKKKGAFQHSSFLAGGATLAAGRLVVEKGVLKAVWPHSGHYRPTPENFQDFICFLREKNVDLTDVKLDSADDGDDSAGKKSGVYFRSNSSEDDAAEKDGLETDENDIEDTTSDNNSLKVQDTAPELELLKPLDSFGQKLSSLQIPSNHDFVERLKNESLATRSSSHFSTETTLGGYETPRESFASEHDMENISDEEHDETTKEVIPEQSILQRISSHKESKSYQLGQHLSCRWSTGAGPRIGCLRDYPSGLQSHALEQVSLSPRSARSTRSEFPSRASTPISLSPTEKRSLSGRNSRFHRKQSTSLHKDPLQL